MGSGGPLPSGQRRWLTLYYARHTWAEVDAQDLPAAMTNDPDAFPSKPRRRAGGSDNGHHETRAQRRRRLGGDAATPSSQNELRPPPTRKAQPQASVGPPAPPKRRLPLAEASFAEPESRPIRDRLGVPGSEANRGRQPWSTGGARCAHLRRPRRLWLFPPTCSGLRGRRSRVAKRRRRCPDGRQRKRSGSCINSGSCPNGN